VLSFNSASQNSANQITFSVQLPAFIICLHWSECEIIFHFMASVNWLLLLFAVGNAAVDSGDELLVKGKHQGVFFQNCCHHFINFIAPVLLYEIEPILTSYYFSIESVPPAHQPRL
jgi:hypothetical protein